MVLLNMNMYVMFVVWTFLYYDSETTTVSAINESTLSRDYMGSIRSTSNIVTPVLNKSVTISPYYNYSQRPKIEGDKTRTLFAGENLKLNCTGNRPMKWIGYIYQEDDTHIDELPTTEEHAESDLRTITTGLQNISLKDVKFYMCMYSSDYQDIDWSQALYDHRLDYIYLYIKNSSTYLLPMEEYLLRPQDHPMLIPCRPNNLDVEVAITLGYQKTIIKYLSYDPRIGFTIPYSESLNRYKCVAYNHSIQNVLQEIYIQIWYYENNLLPPSVEVIGEVGKWSNDTYFILERGEISFRCTTVNKGSTCSMQVAFIQKNQIITQEKGLFVISNMRSHYSGIYYFYATNTMANSTSTKVHVKVIEQNADLLLIDNNASIQCLLLEEIDLGDTFSWWIMGVFYPLVSITLFRRDNVLLNLQSKVNDKSLDQNSDIFLQNGQYSIIMNKESDGLSIVVENVTVKNQGTYNLTLKTRAKTESLQLILKTEAKPFVELSMSPKPDIKLLSQTYNITCTCWTSDSNTILSLFFCKDLQCLENQNFKKNKKSLKNQEELISTHVYNYEKIVKTWKGNAKVQGYYQCLAASGYEKNTTEPLVLPISESEFPEWRTVQVDVYINGILQPVLLHAAIFLPIKDKVILRCRANKLIHHKSIIWRVERSNNKLSNCKESINKSLCYQERRSKYSYIMDLIVNTSDKSINNSKIECKSSTTSSLSKSYRIIVYEPELPYFIPVSTKMQSSYTRRIASNLTLMCQAKGRPHPQITWTFNGRKILSNDTWNISEDGQILTIKQITYNNAGIYLCKASNMVGDVAWSTSLDVTTSNEKTEATQIATFGLSGILVIIFFGLVFYFTWKAKRKSRIIEIEIHREFEHGEPERINPDIQLISQADLLPYDKSFEFSREKLIFETMLGSGEFGKVYKARALGLEGPGTSTTVAVKTTASTNDDQQVQALKCEAKIMIKIGRHVNIVNILGVCSKQLHKKDLQVIVEYCPFGDLLNYMKQHRSLFNEDQDVENYSFSSSCQPLVKSPTPAIRCHDADNHEYMNTRQECGLSRHKSLNHRRSSIMATYDVPRPRPILSGTFNAVTLISWGHQIANGMAYLTDRRVLHGDLAARNILLAENNLVKISDFGLSRKIYKNADYKAKTTGRIPLRWMALEVMEYNEMTSKSDVWSYGVTMWEIFTLGQVPYHNTILELEQIIPKLRSGVRLEHPKHCDDITYELLSTCWNEDPEMRPEFIEIKNYFEDLLTILNAESEENISIQDDNVSTKNASPCPLYANSIGNRDSPYKDCSTLNKRRLSIHEAPQVALSISERRASIKIKPLDLNQQRSYIDMNPAQPSDGSTHPHFIESGYTSQDSPSNDYLDMGTPTAMAGQNPVMYKPIKDSQLLKCSEVRPKTSSPRKTSQNFFFGEDYMPQRSNSISIRRNSPSLKNAAFKNVKYNSAVLNIGEHSVNSDTKPSTSPTYNTLVTQNIIKNAHIHPLKRK